MESGELVKTEPLVAREKGSNGIHLRLQAEDGKFFNWHVTEFEKTLVDVFLKTLNYAEVNKQLMEKFGHTLTPQTIKLRVEKGFGIKEYIKQRINSEAIYNSLTKEKYVADSVLVLEEGRKQSSAEVALWKLIGEAKGFFTGDRGSVNTQVNIRVTQANGEE